MKNQVGILIVALGFWINAGWGPNRLEAAVSDNGGYSSDQYWIGRGQGDLTKGKMVCQRVSELSARTDLAKQIRVLVKEHLIDRVRERSGRESEQDIELTREELVQEYLQDVKIIDRRIDEENKMCTATAVMPKNRVQSAPAPDQESAPARLP
ncbi:MAG: LPP20 family lipoprotein [Nitrospira sp.]|nr:LPP20 family lipoprotein [Nitrospira sp.]